MASREPAGTTRPTVSRAHRRRLLAAFPVLLLAPVALMFAALTRLPSEDGRPLGQPAHIVTPNPRTGAASVAWPSRGQAAVAFGNGRPAAGPDQEPAPIASLAKVMTAYLTLERYPLTGEQKGFAITVGVPEVQAEVREAAQGQSVVTVRAGEELTERQLLEALLIPSGNNIAQLLAGVLAGGEASFVGEMNDAADALGMDHTTYTDPSGFDPGTVSTAADQLRLFQRAMRFSVFRQIVSMAGVTLPVTGTLTNFNPLIAQGYAGKTGSDSAAGGCLAFFTHVTSGERPVTVAGVVMGQGQGDDTRALLAAAGEAAEQLVGSAVTGAPGRGGAHAPRQDVRDDRARRGGQASSLASAANRAGRTWASMTVNGAKINGEYVAVQPGHMPDGSDAKISPGTDVF